MDNRAWILCFILIITLLLSGCRNSREVVYESSHNIVLSHVNSVLELYVDKYGNYLNDMKDTTKFPQSLSEGQIVYSGSSSWTSGFFPGIIWNLYELENDERFKDAAIKWTNSLLSEKDNTSTHDVGFIINCSFGQGYKLTADSSYRETLIEASKSLASRFNNKIGMIKSLDNFRDYRYPVLIDNLVNLEMLFKSWKWTGDDMFYNVAYNHALTSMENMFRLDHSLFQIVDYDPDNYSIRTKGSFQGYSDNSDWARGLSWGIYGYVMCFRETGDRIFLDQAERITRYMLNHPNIESDLIPYWDLNAPGIPDEPRDAAAAAILASALIELSSFPESGDPELYLSSAEKIINTLCSDEYTARQNKNSTFVLKHCTGNYPANTEVDVPLIYADYYFLEALLRYRDLNLSNND